MFSRVKIPMKIRILATLVSLTLLLIPHIAYGEGQIKYTIRIESEGSAAWVINQVAQANASIDTWEEFQSRVASLVEATRTKTGREITAEVESMTFAPSGSYVVVEYKFNWKNFSKTENPKIIIGDVFQVESFFLHLYGDGEVYIAYPSEYIVETVSPLPYEQDDSHQTIRWLGNRDFISGLPTVVLREKSLTPGFLETLQQNAIVIVSLVAIAFGSSVSLYVFWRRKKKEIEITRKAKLPSPPGIESAEEKIVTMLKSSGGSSYQSAIADQCKFSKAKTSQLLALLEGRGVVSRYKKGRDKIVFLVEQDEK